MNWRRVKAPKPLLNQFPNMQAWQKDVDDGHLTVFAGEESVGFHMSISHRLNSSLKPGRYPTWDEIYDARYRFCPLNKTMVMHLPPQSEYVNYHETTFHLWELE